MPYAKAVSAKSHDFGADGNELHTDYEKMIGIEYEGGKIGEFEGIIRTKDLLEKVRASKEETA